MTYEYHKPYFLKERSSIADYFSEQTHAPDQYCTSNADKNYSFAVGKSSCLLYHVRAALHQHVRYQFHSATHRNQNNVLDVHDPRGNKLDLKNRPI